MCNACNETRNVNGHQFGNHCNPTCNICGLVRIVPHTWSNAHDTICVDCGADIYGDCSNHADEDNDGHCDHCEIPKKK